MSLDRAQLRERYERRLQLQVPPDPELLKNLPLFAGIPEKAREKVIDKVRKYLHLAWYNPGDDILRQGEYGDSAFYIVEGAAEVFLGKDDGSDKAETRPPKVRGGAHVPPSERPGARPGAEGMVGTGRSGTAGTVILSAFSPEVLAGKRTVLEKGEIFGELSALSRYPVSANVRAQSRLRLLQIRLPGLRMLTASSKEFRAFLDKRYK